MKKILTFGILLCLLFPVIAEEILLKNGNRLYGKIVEQDETTCVLETGYGVISLSWSQIREVRGVKSLLEQYWERLDRIDPQETEQLWELAVWCETNALENQRDFLFAKILAMNPNHVNTLRHLQLKLYNGQWISAQYYKQLTQPRSEEKIRTIQESPQIPKSVEVVSETISTETEIVESIPEEHCAPQRIYRNTHYSDWPSFSGWNTDILNQYPWEEYLHNGDPLLIDCKKREPRRERHRTETPPDSPKRKWIPKTVIVQKVARPAPKISTATTTKTQK